MCVCVCVRVWVGGWVGVGVGVCFIHPYTYHSGEDVIYVMGGLIRT